MPYRPDIDGLRGFAILSVLLFHLGVRHITGGFTGVDVFFVISGYLITGLILHELQEGGFSFWNFYARRTRRIYPALFTMIPLVLIAGYFVLLPGEYRALGQSAVYSSLFLPNIYFWLHTGYFDSPAETMPLLHLWSIGVEEQFYIIWPLTLFLAFRYLPMKRRGARFGVGLATAALAIVCIVWTKHDAKAAFFLPFTRLWEFTLGAGLLAIPAISHRGAANLLSVAGLGAMLIAVLFFRHGPSYPGYFALLPCFGAAATIAAGPESFIGRFLSLRPNVFLGKISYSLYLWHWPLIVYGGFVFGGAGHWALTYKLVLALLAFGIACLSWRFIELPIRRQRGMPARHIAYGAVGAAAACCLALIVVLEAGFPGRLPEQVRDVGDHESMIAFDCTEHVAVGDSNDKRCIVGAAWETAAKRAVVFGDSHAFHIMPLLDIVGREQNIAIFHWPGCLPFIGDKVVQRGRMSSGEYVDKCALHRRQFLDWLAKNKVDLVMMAGRWAGYPNLLYGDGIFDASHPAEALDYIDKSMRKAINELDPRRQPILLVGDVPPPNYDVPDCAVRSLSGLWRRPCPQYRAHFEMSPAPLHKILSKLATEYPNVYFHDTSKTFCVGSSCPVSLGKQLIFRDGNHLRQDLNPDTRNELVARLGLREAVSTALNGPMAAGPGEVEAHATAAR